ncbi:S8 family peptidase [Paenibacillus taiwanensis]|uniref:S8 family peptidase n=1 Tax=Paenibacillus taiwanensis TaxID=401638 RepID=UPI00041748B7|nr:S8 family peptidase [Paenibacillus taiwanensis]
MKIIRNVCLLFCTSCILLVSLFVPPSLSAQEEKRQYFISFKSQINTALIYSLGGKIVESYPDLTMILAELSAANAAKLKGDPQIEFVEQDRAIHVLPEQGTTVEREMSHLSQFNQGQVIQWGAQKVKAIEAQQEGYMGKGIKIGIIDSGIDYTHEDLSIAGGVNIIDGSANFMDDYGHGTEIAGIIGALPNHIGVLGIAPDARIYGIKVLDAKGDGHISHVVKGITWSIDHHMDIVNLSFQTKENSKALKKVIKKAYQKGLLLIGAAGNNGFNEGNTVEYPAAYKEVIAVGAINSRDERTFYSGRGKELDVMAPGASIYSTTLHHQYTMTLGTSMAAAHVSGVAALIMEAKPHLNNREIRSIVMHTASKMGERNLYGHGLVDALKAIHYPTSK